MREYENDQIWKGSEGERHRDFYQNLGQGKPAVLIYGWSPSSLMWDYQRAEFPEHGLRVIAYDRRGFGKSSKPFEGYNYGVFANGLKAVLEELDLRDVTLVGMSMGGGEIARYIFRHGTSRISKVVFVSGVPPFMLKTDDNPDGVNKKISDEMKAGITGDRASLLEGFGKQFYGVTMLNKPVSAQHLQVDFTRSYEAFHKATPDCVDAFSATDFRRKS